MRLKYKDPLDDYVLFKPVIVDKLRGLVLPGHKATEDTRVYGIVTKVGPGRWENGRRVPMQVAPGDLIILGQNVRGGGYAFLGEERLVNEQGICCTIEEDAESIVHFDGRLCGEQTGQVSEFLSDVECPKCMELATGRAITVAMS